MPSLSPSEVPSMAPSVSAQPSEAPWTYVRPTRVDVRYLSWMRLERLMDGDLERSSSRQLEKEDDRNSDADVQLDDDEADAEANDNEAHDNEADADDNANEENANKNSNAEVKINYQQVIQSIQQLGYNEYSWDNYGVNPIESKGWRDLKEQEREAAMGLGFDEKSW